MTRTVKLYAVRRNEILDKAQEFFYSKGYEQTSIKDIIDGVGIAKGTFYHYFSSKVHLLDALIERMLDHTMQMVEPIVEDTTLDGLQKFHLFFSTIENWKIDNRPFLKSLLQVFYHDDNVILRQKLKMASINVTTPPLTKIIQQGVEEGIFDTSYPDEVGEVIIIVGQSFAEKLAYFLLEDDNNRESAAIVECKIEVTNNSLERLLGAPDGSVNIFDFGRIRQWFEPDEDPPENTIKARLSVEAGLP